MSDNSEEPITPENASPRARDIVARLVVLWREGGLPPAALAEALIDAGLDQISNEHGPAATVRTEEAR
jgi:hypothetical protein